MLHINIHIYIHMCIYSYISIYICIYIYIHIHIYRERARETALTRGPINKVPGTKTPTSDLARAWKWQVYVARPAMFRNLTPENLLWPQIMLERVYPKRHTFVPPGSANCRCQSLLCAGGRLIAWLPSTDLPTCQKFKTQCTTYQKWPTW
jgi:hypothetical protein